MNAENIMVLTVLLDYVCLVLLSVAHHEVLLQAGWVQVFFIAAIAK
jgi:hypothetical protein